MGTNLTQAAALRIAKAQGLTITGNRAMLVTHPANRVLAIHDSSDITVSGLIMDYNPLPFTQARITRLALNDGCLQFRVEPGYDDPSVGDEKLYRDFKSSDAVFLDGSTRAFTHDWGRISSVRAVSNHVFEARFHNADMPKRFARLKPGDFIAIKQHFTEAPALRDSEGRYLSANSANIYIAFCQRVQFNDIHSYAAPGMTFVATGSEGLVLDGCRIVRKPGTNRLIASNSDGAHFKSLTVMPEVRNSVFEALMDDSINIKISSEVVREVSGTRMRLVHGDIVTDDLVLHAGQELMFLGGTAKRYLGGAKVMAVERLRYREAWITLDKAIEGLAAGDLAFLRPASDAVVSGCEFNSQLKTALLTRPPTLVSKCVFNGVAYGIHSPFNDNIEGPPPQGTRVSECTFNDSSVAAIALHLPSRNSRPPGGRALEMNQCHVTVGDNRGTVLNAYNQDGISLRDVQIMVKDSRQKSDLIRLRNCTNVVEEKVVFSAAVVQAEARQEIKSAGLPAAKPNVLLIYTDDHGWADLGIQGVDKDIRTPNLDQLAKDGVRFTRGYVSAPQCMPSRAGVITGRYQQRFGVEDNSKGPLPLSEVTIAERLKPAGYISGFVGKSHLDIGGKEASQASRVMPGHLPHHQGFDEYFRGELRQFYASHDLQGKPFADAPHLVTDNRFRVVVQTEAALSFLDRRANKPGQPWFLYLAWFAPHVPLESPEPWFGQTPESLPLKRRQALAMIAAMDDGLGRIRARLKEMGQERNTLIFFIGDNGAPLGNAWDGSVNLPMVGQKGMLAEGGIRTPFIAAWPGRWPAGTTYDLPVISLDVAATAAGEAGLSQDSRLDGVNLTPFVTGQKQSAPHERLFWRWGSQAAVLEMPYKLIKLGIRPSLLFNVTHPEGENLERNLAAQHPEIVALMEKRLQAWAAELQPPGLSTENSGFTRHHEDLFAVHHIIAGESSDAPATVARTGRESADAGIQGWIARNGSLAEKDGALMLTADGAQPENARPFVTHSRLDVAGPVTVQLRVRAAKAGEGRASIAWRTKSESFEPHQSATFDWPVGEAWQEVQVQLSEKSHIIHVRIHPPKGASGIEIQSIEFKGSDGKNRAFRFASQ